MTRTGGQLPLLEDKVHEGAPETPPPSEAIKP